MFSYYIRMAFTSFAKTPGITALTAGAIAAGVAVSVVTFTVYHMLSGNPIWWKNDRLYAVTMDNYPARLPPQFKIPHVEDGPYTLTYRDATHLMSSDIPERKTITYPTIGVASGGTAERVPSRIRMRITTADFFGMFDVPFRYGGPWSLEADRRGAAVAVLSSAENDRLFGGVNSVGREVRLNDRPLRIVGVLDRWSPVPRFYDLDNGPLEPPEDIYVPWGPGFGLSPVSGRSTGSFTCIQLPKDWSVDAFLSSECVWLTMWVELPNAAARTRMQSFIDNYWSEQHRAGRFPRPRHNRLANVDQWLVMHQFLANDNLVLVGVGLAFFAVCVINVVGLLLAKFLSRASVTGMRRALGASRRQIILQHIVEAGVIACLGALAGLVLAELGLRGVYAWVEMMRDVGSPSEPIHFDSWSLLWALALAAAAALGAGLYPAWRAGRLPPAAYLKSQ